MITYSKFQSTNYDTRGLGLEDRQDWLIAPVGQNRDSSAWEQSNFAATLARLEKCDYENFEDDVETHRFGHWANGWFEIILVRPGSIAAEEVAKIEKDLANYPLLDEDDYHVRLDEEAHNLWKTGYSPYQRVEYIRRYRRDIEFNSWSDLLSCVRGNFYPGDAKDLLG